MVIVISSAGENDWNVRLLLFHRGGRVTNRDADSWAETCIGVRTVDEVRMMKRHFTRPQNDIDRMVHVERVGNCVTSSQDVCLLRFFKVIEGSGMSSRQHTETAIVDSAIRERDPCGNEARF